MASEGSTQAIIKRRNDELALMPPPPTKRIKQPSETLDEDQYTDALSDIIARDYYPGLREAKAQEEYLNALESKNPEWIEEAGQKLRAVTNGEVEVKRTRRGTRDTRFDTHRSYKQAAETPRGPPTGADTPVTIAGTGNEEDDSENDRTSGKSLEKQDLDTANLSLTSYQAKYTSEDNASFNSLLNKQNDSRRQKHSYLWTPDQKRLSTRQIEYRKTQQNLLQERKEYESANGRALIPLTSGSTAERPAKPNSWKISKPDNNLMFTPSTSVDEIGMQTVMEVKEEMSKAGPKEIVHANTRFPPSGPRYSAIDDNDNDNDDTTSIHTSYIAQRNKSRNTPHQHNDIPTSTTLTGAETPRVNGYTFVDEDGPPPPPPPQSLPSSASSSLLLPANSSSPHPNPFKLQSSQKREAIHHRLVEQSLEKKRAKQKESTPAVDLGAKHAGNMTPAAQKLLGRLGGGAAMSPNGRTRDTDTARAGARGREDWTPVATPRRRRAGLT